MEDYSSNDCKKGSVKISAIRQHLKPIFIFPIISVWKLLSCQSIQSAYATAIFVEPNAMNISVKFQLHPPGVDILLVLRIEPFGCHDNYM